MMSSLDWLTGHVTINQPINQGASRRSVGVQWALASILSLEILLLLIVLLILLLIASKMRLIY